MWKIKLVIGLLLVAGGAGLYAYVKHLQAENATLAANNAIQSAALDEQANTIDQLNADIGFKADQVAKRQAQVSRLNEINAKLKGDLNAISKEDPVVEQCLAVVPSDTFINKLREYSRGQNSEQGDTSVSRPIVLQ